MPDDFPSKIVKNTTSSLHCFSRKKWLNLSSKKQLKIHHKTIFEKLFDNGQKTETIQRQNQSPYKNISTFFISLKYNIRLAKWRWKIQKFVWKCSHNFLMIKNKLKLPLVEITVSSMKLKSQSFWIIIPNYLLKLWTKLIANRGKWQLKIRTTSVKLSNNTKLLQQNALCKLTKICWQKGRVQNSSFRSNSLNIVPLKK